MALLCEPPHLFSRFAEKGRSHRTGIQSDVGHRRDRFDVLLVTVYDIETKTLLETARPRTNRGYKELPGEHKTYFDLGVIGGSRVLRGQVGKGASGIGGSLVTITDAIEPTAR